MTSSIGVPLSLCSGQVFCTTQFMPSKNPAQRLADIIDNVDAIQGLLRDSIFRPFGPTEKPCTP